MRGGRARQGFLGMAKSAPPLLAAPSAPLRKRVLVLLAILSLVAVLSTFVLLGLTSREATTPPSPSSSTSSPSSFTTAAGGSAAAHALGSRILPAGGRPMWEGGVWHGFGDAAAAAAPLPAQQEQARGSAEPPPAPSSSTNGSGALPPPPFEEPQALAPAAVVVEKAAAAVAPAEAPAQGSMTAGAGAGQGAPAPPLEAAPLLVVGIPSMRRLGDLNYVQRTLQYLLQQTVTNGTGDAAPGGASDVPGPHPLRIRLLVMDHTRAPGTHAAFEASRRQFCGSLPSDPPLGAPSPTSVCSTRAMGAHMVASAPGSLVTFAWNGIPRVEDGSDAGTDNFPGARVRAQSRDVVALLELAGALFHGAPTDRAAYYMFLEDDFRVCPQGLRSLAFGLARATGLHGSPEWNALRVSYGLNGGVLRGGDIGVFAGYLGTHLARRPPDHLWVEWFAGETPESAEHKRGRPHAAFRYNILEHFGASSSLRGKAAPLYALCYDVLDERVVFEVEAFKAMQCAHDFVWPCWLQGDGRYQALIEGSGGPGAPTAGLDFAELASQARLDSVQQYALG